MKKEFKEWQAGYWEYTPARKCDTYPEPPYGISFIWNSIVRSAIIWAQLNPHATVGQRVLLLQDVAASLGIDASCIG
ncbi:hypothetical protein [Acetobacter oryzifermentans]|uniref:Uncharacterized protein n=1 Tax=Acetobacter oryzifermentans TaxID=1633874 RepID=A0ABM6AGU3_9PROT|nr:hypothetical protein [Acetobacter oryzifermentans]ANA12901.1 hypothetical protein WG31_01775 [Acetobacter oryzifermentans]